MGIDAFIGAHKHKSGFENIKDSAPFPLMIDGKKTDDNGYFATMFTFTQRQMQAVSYDEKQNLCGEHICVFAKLTDFCNAITGHRIINKEVLTP